MLGTKQYFYLIQLCCQKETSMDLVEQAYWFHLAVIMIITLVKLDYGIAEHAWWTLARGKAQTA